MVTAKLGAGGRLSLFNAAGTTQVIADVAGWYDDGSTASGARFHPLTPRRILDTRSTAPLGAGATMSAQVTGQGGVPSTGVSAVVRVSLYNAAGSTQIVIDVAGWYDDGTSATGAGYHPVTPSRILDTRSGVPLGTATSDLQAAGRGGVPSTGVSAVIMNVAVTGPTVDSYLAVFPTGEATPATSNLNFVAGQTVPNLVVAKLGAGGKVSLANAAGTTHVIADVAGWLD